MSGNTDSFYQESNGHSTVLNDDKLDSQGIEIEKGEILPTGYTALPFEDEDGECSDSENSCSVELDLSMENSIVIDSTEQCSPNDQDTVRLSAQDVEQIRNAMQG